ncbi:P-loop containing nucleoside triphosphate hydrolase protein, partial [Punctularia strigosozonata HHB-11173 SS5]|uniref:P-loop containing nucleoside triphosphate hydrolase protein n=1 Tax=Punctularia strigosozonata (strain HHB-11173) TaxID=741275 RepID=UPI000441684D
WLESLLKEKCNITSVRPFQLDHGLDLMAGRDLMLVTATGTGKTTVLHAPLLAAQARKETGIAFIVIPTKLLGEQHAKSATSRGLYSLCLNEDTVRDARDTGQDLFKEAFESPGIRVISISPQMLQHQRINQYLSQATFKRQIRWFFVDEAQLVNQQFGEWCTAYRALKHMRARLFTSVTWAAVTGTATHSEAAIIRKELGFHPSSFVNARYSIDRPNIKYIPRFFEHPYTGYQFLDLSFLIPCDMTAPTDIPTTLIFAETIELGWRIMVFLDHLIPLHVPHRRSIIKLYNSLFERPYREEFIKDIQSGEILRIGVCTDTCAYGFDAPNITRVVIAGIPAFQKDRPPSFAAQMQKIGRAVRNGSLGVAYTFAPPWVRIIPENEITTAQQKTDAARRAKLDPQMLQWFNSSQEFCPRQSNLAANDEPFAIRDGCCAFHAPSPEFECDATAVACWKERLETARVSDSQPLRSDGTYKALEPQMRASLIRMLEGWRGRTWGQLRGDRLEYPSVLFFPTNILRQLAEKVHLCTTFERFCIVVSGWDHLDEHGAALFRFVSAALEGFGDVIKERSE